MVEVCGTSDGHTLNSRDCVRLEGSNPDGPFLCELAQSILIIIHVKRSSSLSLIALADTARGEAKTDPENTAKKKKSAKQQRVNVCVYISSMEIHKLTLCGLVMKTNLKLWRLQSKHTGVILKHLLVGPAHTETPTRT